MTRRTAAALMLVSGVALVLILVGRDGEPAPYGTGTNTTAPSGEASVPSTSGAGAAGNVIAEKGNAFDPASLTVDVGDTVTFIRPGAAPHHRG